jgi:diguanylate cyclase (GGDEF)-like protein/PAS domain S-box-containing protein
MRVRLMRLGRSGRVRSPSHSFDHLRPGARAVVLSLAFVLVLASALVTSQNVSGHLTATAMQEAVRSAETHIRADIDPLLSMGAMRDPASPDGAEINRELEVLVAAGGILRLKIWGPDGTVLFSDLPALRGVRFDPSDELEEAFAGENATELTAPDQPENIFETGLANTVLEIYLPVRDRGSGTVVGAYEVYEDAAPILAAVDETRRDVFLVAVVMAGALLTLLYLAFAGTWARLVRANLTLRRLTGQVRRSEARFRSLIQNSGDVFAVLDPRGRLTYASVAVRQVLGYRSVDLGRSSLMSLIHPDDVQWARRLFGEVLARPRSQHTGETRVQHADGTWRVMEWTLTNLVYDSTVGGVVVNARDISQRKELEEQLSHQALHDPLTGLPNRALLTDRIEHALARRDDRHRAVAVLFLDLDDFKTVNDSLGHGVGDKILAAVADRLRVALRPADTVARMGGDEFAILIDEPVTAGAPTGVAERILDAFHEPMVIGRRAVSVGASIGIAWSNGRRLTASDLLRDADVAMYAAKRRGKGRYEVFQTGMRADALVRLELKADLDRALADGQLVLHYQPVVDLADGRIVGVEALVRWNHPRRGLLAPESFIHLAEETGQIVALGRWVLGEACRQSADWARTLGRSIPVAVNLSARELQDGRLIDHVRECLASTGTDPASLTVEVTESVWVEEVETSGRVLEALRELGVHLAIDDFGIGYSSLSYLQRYPFDSLKIDRSFVASLEADGAGEPLVRSMLDLAQRLDRAVVAEGIERPDQLATLWRLGCQLGQGYLMAPPADAGTIERLLRKGFANLSAPTVRVSTRRTPATKDARPRIANGNGHAGNGRAGNGRAGNGHAASVVRNGQAGGGRAGNSRAAPVAAEDIAITGAG